MSDIAESTTSFINNDVKKAVVNNKELVAGVAAATVAGIKPGQVLVFAGIYWLGKQLIQAWHDQD